MELMIVIAFLFVLLCSGLKNGTVRAASSLTRAVYEKWGKGFVDKELESKITEAFTKYPRTEDGKVFRDEFDMVCEMHPECVKPKYGLYKPDEWEIPVVLALHGKLPSQHITSGTFYTHHTVEHFRMYKWIESTLRANGANVTLCTVSFDNSPPKPAIDADATQVYILSWRGTDKNGNFMRLF